MKEIRPTTPYPISQMNRHFVLLKNFITNPNIEVGDFTYYNDAFDPEHFERNNVIMLYTCKLIIGKFCQIAQGTRFIMSDANHQISGFSTYPFFVFGGEWAGYKLDLLRKGDTIVGNDVWLGHESLIMPGIKIGDGAIVAACSVVTKDVPPYTIVGGNPARTIRQRFSDETITKLLDIQWWNWPYEKIARHVQAITGADLPALVSAQNEN